MRITLRKIDLEAVRTDLFVVPVASAELESSKGAGKSKKPRIGRTLSSLDAAAGGAILRRLRQIKFKAGDFESALIAGPAQTVLVVGWGEGKQGSFGPLARFRRLGALIRDEAGRSHARSVVLLAGALGRLNERAIEAIYEGAELAGYSFKKYKKSEKPEDEYQGIAELLLEGSGKAPALEKVEARVRATLLARDLINTCPSDGNPSFMLEACKRVAKEAKLKIEVLDKPKLTKMGAGGILGVSRGSDQPPYIVKLVYKHPRAKRAIALVGKGVTFDSGGLSIKPASGMETMKMDMSGAAAVIATMQALGELEPRIEVRGYVALVENMINGSAMKPGDVIKISNGTTVEVLNTDAEGRLILADALSLASKENAHAIIDLATLTGACVVALGETYAGLFSSDDKLAERLQDAADSAGEPLWRMPLPPEYKDLLKSPVADLKNIGGRWGGAITAALFLKEFVGDSKWAHLDIAGPAFSESDCGPIRRGGVGFGVRTLLGYIGSQAG